mgnify:FL=1
MEEVFNLENSSLYNLWREQKLANYKQAVDNIIKIKDLSKLSQNEKLEILSNCRAANFAIYVSEKKIDMDGFRGLLKQLKLFNPETSIFSGAEGITEISNIGDGRQGEYIPYSNKPLSWHTDGYYNSRGSEICAFILHCYTRAKSGGVSSLLDHEIAYIKLRDKNPEFIKVMMEPDAFEVPANVENGRVLRPTNVGPVFSLVNGNLHMRFSGRKRFVNWKNKPALLEARIFLEEILDDKHGFVIHHTLQPGEGVICNNVLHRRSAFFDGDSDPRRLFRARFSSRVTHTIET